MNDSKESEEKPKDHQLSVDNKLQRAKNKIKNKLKFFTK